jgi:hypothetical protein
MQLNKLVKRILDNKTPVARETRVRRACCKIMQIALFYINYIFQKQGWDNDKVGVEKGEVMRHVSDVKTGHYRVISTAGYNRYKGKVVPVLN